MISRSLTVLSLFLAAVLTVLPAAQQEPSTMKQAEALHKKGNFKEALDMYRALLANQKISLDEFTLGYQHAIESFGRLDLMDELDTFREQLVVTHKTNPDIITRIGQSYFEIDHYGYLISGEFQRGYRRGGANGAQWANSMQRDIVRAIQLYDLARVTHNDQDDATSKLSDPYAFYVAYARIFQSQTPAFTLEELTDITTLPDYDTEGAVPMRGFGRGRRPVFNQLAGVNEDGSPTFFSKPESFEASKSNGERWRFLLTQAQDIAQKADDLYRVNLVKLQYADLLRVRYGVQTMLSGGYQELLSKSTQGDELNEKTGPFALETLTDEETIAKLATGVKRFALPAEFNYIEIYKEVAKSSHAATAADAYGRLAEEYSNRMQYPKAAAALEESLKRFPSEHTADYKSRRQQIIGNWGEFEPRGTQPAGAGASIDFKYRNGKKVTFTAHAIKVDEFLNDLKAYLKTQPAELDWNKLQIEQIGQMIINQNQKKYQGAQVATWTVDLEPRPNHFDRRITVQTPLQKAGAYLLESKIDDGNTTRVIYWIADTALVRKNVNQKELYYVADAVTGKPVADVNLEFIGFRYPHMDEKNRRVPTLFKNFAEKTNAQGIAYVTDKQADNQFQWLTIARGANGRLAYMGFQGIWFGSMSDQRFVDNKIFFVTDRPVYRPGQKVSWKAWVRRVDFLAKNDAELAPNFGKLNAFFTNPKGEELNHADYEADRWNAISGEYTLPADATLGQWNISIPWQQNVQGQISFRVEEYKKPEFEVTVESPDKPVTLGEKFEATIRAKYYFGAPVTHATVKYKVSRTKHTANWFPPGPWDWYYGNGYRWLGVDYDWYPGFSKWGCFAPHPTWWSAPSDPPEIVVETETEIGADGTVKVSIDTALAKQIFGDSTSHKYSITAEVVDLSRRTITGSGNVIVAAEPFQVSTWLDRGYYNVGDKITATAKAQTLDNKPIQGEGTFELFKITYNADGTPKEESVQTWTVSTDDKGDATQVLQAPSTGQFRLAYRVTSKEGATREGATIFIIRGTDWQSADLKFNALELIPDKATYAVGEKVKLLINADRADSTILLFVRPLGSVYSEPQIINLKGKSTTVELDITQSDLPNFFVEAVTVSGAEVHSITKDILVPPMGKDLNVEITSTKESYLPGEDAEVTIKVTDATGKPVEGSIALTVYDKSVEYISGGSNVENIKEFFWKYRRSHYPRTEHSLNHYSYLLYKNGEAGMQNLGAFGNLAADKAEMNFMAIGGMGGGGRGPVSRATRGMELADGAMPMAAMAAPKGQMAKQNENVWSSLSEIESSAGEAPANVQPTVRKDFADTAFWIANLTTNNDGIATANFKMPENLTQWTMKTWCVSDGSRVGEGSTSAVTAKNIIVRLQAPRFFIETDEVLLSANVHNYLKEEKQATVQLLLEGGTLETTENLSKVVTIPADGEVRVDWKVKATSVGSAIVTMKALTDVESDAMQMTFPVYVHGFLKLESFTGILRPDQNNHKFTINVPADRKGEQSRLEIRYSPTIAYAMVDALPYLANYPYGCTEQTLNRFLPTVITLKALQRMNLDLEAIKNKKVNLNPQELGDAAQRAADWKRRGQFEAEHNPVFDDEEVLKMAKDGLQRLTEMQLSDGGWGWFSGFGEHSSPHTTATVVHGLNIAQSSDLALVPGMLESGLNWLQKYQNEQIDLLKKGDEVRDKKAEHKQYRLQADNLDAFVFMVLNEAGRDNADMRNYLFRDRTHLSIYCLAQFGLALHKTTQAEMLKTVMENISQYLVVDEENQTAYLKFPSGYSWWYWHGNDIEANAYYLKLLSATEPTSPNASRLVKYILNNRKHATYWNSTRDTALCIEAMNDYLVATKEGEAELKVKVLIDGQIKKEVTINKDMLFNFDQSLVLTGDEVTTGEHSIELVKDGNAPLYWNAYLTYFSTEENIKAAGLELKVNRKYFKLVKQEDAKETTRDQRGQSTTLNVEKYDRKELANLDEIESGDLIEIEFTIESKNDYEYILVEDSKPAGCEPVDLQSGYIASANGAYAEFKDAKVALFFRTLPRGTSSLSYRMRAEIPGKFSALPTLVQAMYAPELKANSDEQKVLITE
jgi:uncharacterized protein YfaS (alpha-2-macroglobulin family)